MDEFEGGRFEARVILPAYMLQPMLDVALRFRLVERSQVVRRDHPLPQLLHLRSLHDLAQFGLADEKALQQRLIA